MFSAIDRRRDLMFVHSRDVPFFRDIQEVERAGETVLTLFREGQAGVTNPLFFRNAEVMSYLMTTMISHAIMESVVARPRHLRREDLEETLVRIIAKLLL
jgi:hypothetical protein